ncbi:MAG: hypothetical protein HY830_16585 [Actinobacteria bacterium]|nr:hypothetical protein [Actinomycetota bacterium]
MSQPAAGGAAPRRPWWLMPDRPALPVPTPTELAAIRARVDALDTPAARHPRGRVVMTVVLVAVLVTLLSVDLVSGGPPGTATRWALTLAVGARTGVALVGLVRQGRVDTAVRSRLEADDLPAAAERGRTVPLGKVGATVAAAGAVGSVGLVLALMTTLPAALREDGLAGPLPLIAFLAVLLAASVAGLVVLRTAPVGAGQILDAVDVAVRRRRLLDVLTPLPLTTFLFLVNADVHLPRYELPLRLCALATIAATLGAQSALAHEPLFKDYRLVTAREPKAWLAGEPA